MLKEVGSKEKGGTGVIVARFQVAELTTAHVELIETVRENHNLTIIVLGLSATKATKNNPLDFESRRQMIQSYISSPTIKVVYLPDHPSDKEWSTRLDSLIESAAPPQAPVTLYGARDSFIKYYAGRYKVTELESKQIISGTAQRHSLAYNVKSSKDFRDGVIWATQNAYDKIYTTVDCAPVVYKDGKIEKILFARKNTDGQRYRFIGGFSQPGYDDSGRGDFFEGNARREVEEEAHIQMGPLQYLGSFAIDDWRYRGEKDKISTIFFLGEYLSGTPTPDDDIDELRWVTVEELIENKMFVPTHYKLVQRLISCVREINKIPQEWEKV